jgi:hypothetical protein
MSFRPGAELVMSPMRARTKAAPSLGRTLVAALLAVVVPLCVSSVTIAASPVMEPCQSMEPGKVGSLGHLTLWNLLAGLPADRVPQLDPPEPRDHLPGPEATAQVPARYLTPRLGRAPPLV